MTSPPTTPEPGWYLDPDDPSQRRYWDGSAWTDLRTPLPPTGYGTTAPAWPQAVPAQQTSSQATMSLVLGLLSIVMCGLVTGIPAMLLGRRATREIEESGGRLGGGGVAQAGFVLGLIGTLLTVAAAIFFVLVFGTIVAATHQPS